MHLLCLNKLQRNYQFGNGFPVQKDCFSCLISTTLSRLLVVELSFRFCVSLCRLYIAGGVVLSNKLGLTVLRPCYKECFLLNMSV